MTITGHITLAIMPAITPEITPNIAPGGFCNLSRLGNLQALKGLQVMQAYFKLAIVTSTSGN